MHYEIWALNAGNLIGDFNSEAEVLSVARDLIADGWHTDNLGLRQEWDDGEEGDDARLPPALYGPSLAAWMERSQAGIERRPGVIGGSACIRGMRIPVWLLEQARRLGSSEADLRTAYPSLRAEDLVNTWAYVWRHREEIDREIDENESA
jgi:uncharacterized protein (DUF433 family)